MPEKKPESGCTGCLVPLGFLAVVGIGTTLLGAAITAEDAYGISFTSRHPANKENLTFSLALGADDIVEESLPPYARESIASKDSNPYHKNAAIIRFIDREAIIALDIGKRPDYPDSDFSPTHAKREEV